MLSELEFRARFTLEEKRRIYAAAKQSVDLQIYLDDLKAVDPAVGVDVTSAQTAGGVQLLAAYGLLDEPAAERVAAILQSDAVGTGTPVGGFALGQQVRVLPPFDAAYGGVYAVQGFGPDAVLIAGGAGFAPEYLEAV